MEPILLTMNDIKQIIAPIYLVGGSVRDQLMGKQPQDWDLATPLTPNEVEARIKAAGKHSYNAGKRFGTIGMKLHGQMVEITTFRTEQYRPGSRKPDVEFVGNITADLARRDFTINAIAQRPNNSLIDPFHGQKDIELGIIRAVGNPTERFKEDPLRMLRMARFSAQFGFTVESQTKQKATRLARKILEVSRERWNPELDKILMSKQPSQGLQILAETQLLNFMIPELSIQIGYDQNSPYHTKPLWEHTLAVVEGSPHEINCRWAALLHDIGKPFTRTNKKDRSNYVFHELLGAEIVDKIGRYLKWSNERRDIVRALVLHHLEANSPLRIADNQAK